LFHSDALSTLLSWLRKDQDMLHVTIKSTMIQIMLHQRDLGEMGTLVSWSLVKQVRPTHGLVWVLLKQEEECSHKWRWGLLSHCSICVCHFGKSTSIYYQQIVIVILRLMVRVAVVLEWELVMDPWTPLTISVYYLHWGLAWLPVEQVGIFWGQRNPL
jgi:hypothetical protein